MDLTVDNIKNLTSLWSLAGKANGRFYSNENYAISTVAKSGWPNRIWFHSPPTKKMLQKVINSNDMADITIPIWKNMAQEKLFNSHDFYIKSELSAMSIQLKDATFKVSGLNFEKVTNASSAALWSQLFLKAFGYSIDPKTVELTMEQVEYFIGNHRSQAIGTAVLYRDTPNTAGIHSIGVVPQHRRKGYAADLLNHVLYLAKQQGAKYATLQASSMAKGLYLKTGFQEDFLIQNFVKH